VIKTLWSHAKTMVRLILMIGALLALPMTARAEDPFDINALPIDDEIASRMWEPSSSP